MVQEREPELAGTLAAIVVYELLPEVDIFQNRIPTLAEIGNPVAVQVTLWVDPCTHSSNPFGEVTTIDPVALHV